MQQQLAMIESLLKANQVTNKEVDPRDEEVDLDHFKVRRRGEDEA